MKNYKVNEKQALAKSIVDTQANINQQIQKLDRIIETTRQHIKEIR